MNLEEQIRKPESKTLEFKRDLSSLSPILKTIIAFANTAGGTLIIGVSSEAKLLGIDQILTEEERLANAIAENIRPVIIPDIEIGTVKGRDLLVVKVSHWRGPFYYKKQGIPGGVYIRLGSTSRPAGPELTAEIQRAAQNTSYDEEPVSDLSPDALDNHLIKHHFNRSDRQIDEHKLRSLGVLVPFDRRLVPSIGGLILFGKKEVRERYVPDAAVRCARFHGISKTHILDQKDVEGTILDAVDEVEQFIKRNTRLAAEIKTMRRKDIPEYPAVAIREALINALAHTDYFLRGASIQVAIYSNRLEIQNPGMFPFGYTLDDFKAGSSRIRNRVIAKVFRELNLIEAWGGGYKRVTHACHVDGYPKPNWGLSSIRIPSLSGGRSVLRAVSEP